MNRGPERGQLCPRDPNSTDSRTRLYKAVRAPFLPRFNGSDPRPVDHAFPVPQIFEHSLKEFRRKLVVNLMSRE
jgi:hypothetical protein